MDESLWGACLFSLVQGWVSHPIPVHPFSPSPFHPFPPILSLNPTHPPPHFHSFPFPSPENTLPAFPHHNHGSTMARSQSLLTPEPTHIVRQPVTICHVCVSSLRTPPPDGKMARSLMPCQTAAVAPFWMFLFYFCRLTLLFLDNSETSLYVPMSAAWLTMSKTRASWSVI